MGGAYDRAFKPCFQVQAALSAAVWPLAGKGPSVHFLISTEEVLPEKVVRTNSSRKSAMSVHSNLSTRDFFSFKILLERASEQGEWESQRDKQTPR